MFRGKLLTLLTRRRGMLVGAIVLAVGAAVAGAALGQTVSTDETYVPAVGLTLPSDKAAALEASLPPASESTESAPSPNQAPPGPSQVPAGHPEAAMPAAISDSPDVQIPVSSEVFATTNSWGVSDGVTYVAVYAGADAQDPSTGRFVILRQNFKTATQSLDSVDVPGAGPVEITNAPLGAQVETSAQNGELAFRGQDGTEGTLHLTGDTLSR